jgi:hypothetical protein
MRLVNLVAFVCTGIIDARKGVAGATKQPKGF